MNRLIIKWSYRISLKLLCRSLVWYFNLKKKVKNSVYGSFPPSIIKMIELIQRNFALWTACLLLSSFIKSLESSWEYHCINTVTFVKPQYTLMWTIIKSCFLSEMSECHYQIWKTIKNTHSGPPISDQRNHNFHKGYSLYILSKFPSVVGGISWFG